MRTITVEGAGPIDLAAYNAVLGPDDLLILGPGEWTVDRTHSVRFRVDGADLTEGPTKALDDQSALDLPKSDIPD